MPVASTKDGAYWKKQVELAKAVRRTHEEWWEQNLAAYAPSGKSTPDQFGAEIHTNRTFTLTERKKADLFYQRPDVTLQPTPWMASPIQGFAGPPDPKTGQPSQVPQSAAVQAHEEIVNEKLSEDGIDATALMDAVLFDIICTQGVGFTKMGYESVTVDVEQEVQTGEQMPPGAILGLGATTPQMETRTVPVPVHQHCFWEHFSGKQAIIPHNFRSTNWDTAPFLGMQFELPLTASNRQKYNLPPDFAPRKSDATQHYEHGTEQTASEDVFTGVEIWYRSALYRDDVQHPDHLTQLVLVDGMDDPAIERDSPYQTLEGGKLAPNSLIGFPIHPISVRTLTDSAYVPSDGTMIRPLENELNVFRTQMVQFRDANILRYVANGDVLPAEALNKIVRSPIGGITVIPSEAYVGEGAIKPLEGGSMPRESFASNDYIDNDLARTIGIDAQQLGVQGDSRTATADQIQQSNANARSAKEQAVVLKRYLKGVTKFATLLQRYLTPEQAAEIVGPERAAIWDAWRQQTPSTVAFNAMPDSALRVDQAVDRKQAQELYSFLANDPYVQQGRGKLLEKLLRKFHIDPAGIVAPPPEKKPEPPKLSLAVKGEDFVAPQAPIIVEICMQLGIKISPEAVMQSQQLLLQAEQLAAAEQAAKDAGGGPNTAHGGKLAGQESLSKHASDLTGGMQGSGAPAALGAGGTLQ